MGNASSSSPPPPPAPPVEKELAYPGSKAPQSIIPGRPSNPRPDGVSITQSDECGSCTLQFDAGISTSSVTLTREFGGVRSCSKYSEDLEKVKKKEMSVRDFVGGIQAGGYMKPLSDGFCEEVRFPDDVVQKIVTIDDLNNNLSKLTSTRIRKISSEGFSSDTKALIKPSIPFRMSFSGTDFTIDTLSVYHPCPLRVQDQQADAVISLNDPSVEGTRFVILVPITTGNPSTPSAEFFGKIANQLSNIELPNPSTGQYTSTDVQTGKNWSLSNLFPITDVGFSQGKVLVKSGYFLWEGEAPFERYLEVNTPSLRQWGWRRKEGTPKVTYIMLEKALPVSPNDLATLIRSVPVTEWTDAIHGIMGKPLYSTGPPLPPGSCNVPMRESMTNPFDEISCDPFLNNAQFAKTNQFTSDKILDIVFKVALAIAAAIGAYIALAAVARMYDVEYADFSKGVGKVMGVWAKNIGGKMSKIGNAASMVRGGPMAGLAAAGPAALLPPAAANPASIATLLPPAPPIGDLISARRAEAENAIANEGPRRVTQRTRKTFGGPSLAPESPFTLPATTAEPIQMKNWNAVQTPYLNRGTRKAGIRRGRGRGD